MSATDKAFFLVVILLVLNLFVFGMAYTGLVTLTARQDISVFFCDFDILDIDDQVVQLNQNLQVDVDFNVSPVNATYTYSFSDDTSLFEINSTTGVIDFTPTTGIGYYTIAISISGTCSPSTESFDLVIHAPPSTPTGGGTAGPGLREESPPRAGGCTTDDNCPSGFRCIYGYCDLIPGPEEIAELPFYEEEGLEPGVYPPRSPENFLNPDLIDYPSPGLINALRDNLIFSQTAFDLSDFNVYYEAQETHFGIFLRRHEIARNIFSIGLTALLIVGIVLIVLGSRRPKVVIGQVEYERK